MNFSDFKNSKNLLTNEQMKNVMGGFGTCGWKSASGDSRCGVPKSEAIHMADGGHWCCDSCIISSYCRGWALQQLATND